MEAKTIYKEIEELGKQQSALQTEILPYLRGRYHSIDTSFLKEISRDTPIPYYTIKHKFGQLFYGSLCPLNGSSSENKRFSDGDNHIYNQSTALAGPVVWKKIGIKEAHSKRVYWVKETQVFDKLLPAHVDLMINGERNRLDQKEVALDFLHKRDKIKLLLDGTLGKKAIIMLSQPFVLEYSIALTYGHDRPLGIIKQSVDRIHINSTSIGFRIKPTIEDFSRFSELENGDRITGDFNFDMFKSGLDRSISDIKGTFTGSNNYSYILLNLNELVKDPEIANHYIKIMKKYHEGIEVFGELQRKYATRLVIKGLF